MAFTSAEYLSLAKSKNFVVSAVCNVTQRIHSAPHLVDPCRCAAPSFAKLRDSAAAATQRRDSPIPVRIMSSGRCCVAFMLFMRETACVVCFAHKEFPSVCYFRQWLDKKRPLIVLGHKLVRFHVYIYEVYTTLSQEKNIYQSTISFTFCSYSTLSHIVI